MAKIRFEDGTIVNFNGTPTPEDVDYVAKQLQIKPQKTFAQKEGGDLMNRGKDIAETLKQTAAGKISPVETGIRTVGAVAGGVGDVIGEAITPLLKPVLEPIFKTGAGQAALEAIRGGAEVYNKWKTSSPEATRAAKSLEGVVNIATLLPAYKAGEVGVNAAVKTGVRAGEVASKAAQPLGRGLEKVGERVAKSAIPLSKMEAGAVQSFKAKTPLMSRLAGAEGQPMTAGLTAFKEGFAGTEEMIGIQAKRLADDLWQNTVRPALKGIKTKINTTQAIKNAETNLLSKIKNPSRVAEIKDAFDALRADWKGLGTISHEFAQDVKSEMYKMMPDKLWKGKPIGSAFKEAQAAFASELRNASRRALKGSDDVLSAFDKYGNLKALMEFGQAAMTGAKKKGGFGSLLTSIYENATVPIKTIGGQVLKKAGTALKSIK
jgi:hypothetical protein